jgi:hypothetical protein
MRGLLRKMTVTLTDPVGYGLNFVDQPDFALNPFVGQRLTIKWHGLIECQHCGRKTKKSFSQGYCYPCSQRLAQCDLCVMSPERCHYDKGTCREPAWGEEFCMQSHIVYLANSTGIKVGITRPSQVPIRWIDQGAIQALPIMRVASRQLSGFVEVLYKAHISDKTHWQRMLKGAGEPLDLVALRDDLYPLVQAQIEELQAIHGINAVMPVTDVDPISINYPVLQYPVKVSSMNLEKTPEVSGLLQGIKGQYLIFDTGVINLRKYTGYDIEVAAG